MAIYKGFSTFNRLRKYQVTDFDLVKQDIFNHFNIRQGEKLMNPSFGTMIWNMLFEPLTTETKSVIVKDIQRIVNYEPRVVLNNINLTEYQYGLQIDLTLTYLTTNQTDTISLKFDKNSQSMGTGRVT